MKKKFSAQIALFTVLAIGTGVLAGCGSSSGSSSNATSAAASSSVSTEAAASATVDTEASADTSSTTADTSKAAGDAVQITAVTGGDTRPYVYVGEDNELTGVDIEILKAAFNQLDGYELNLEVASFDAIFGGLTAGQYQIGVNNFSYRAERAENYLYSYPYNRISYDFVYRSDEEPITTFADAAGRSIEAGAGVSVTNALETWNSKNPDQAIDINYTEAQTTVQLQHVVDGQYDFAIIDAAMYDAYEKEYNFGLKATPINDEDTALIADNIYAYYLLPLDQTELRDQLNIAIKSLRDDGTIKQITEEYEGYDGTPDESQYETTIN